MKHQMIQDQDQILPAVDLAAALDAFADVWRRRWKPILVFFFAGILASLGYLLVAEPKYTAWASIIIDPRSDKSPSGPETAPLVMTEDALIVDSEVKVLKSREVTARAVEALELANSESAHKDSVGARVRNWLRSEIGLVEESAIPTDTETNQRILLEGIRRDFVEDLNIERSGETYVIDISYTASDPMKASESANAVLNAYLAFSSDRRNSDFGQLNEWLGSRLNQLEEQVRISEAAVADYRKTNQIYKLEGGLLPSEVELSSATQTLISMRERIVALSVKIEKLTLQIEAGEFDSVTLEPEDRTIALVAFEERYTDLLQSEISAIQQRGEESPIVLDLRRSKEQVRGLILDELNKIRGQLVTRYETLDRRISDTERLVDTLREKANEDGQKLIELRRLERQSGAKQRIFEDLLASFNSSAELRSFGGTPARVIAWAVPPDEKSAPKSTMIVVLAGFGSLILGLSFAYLLETTDGTLRRSKDLTKLTGLRFLGVLPTISSEKRRMRAKGLRSHDMRSAVERKGIARFDDLRFAADNPRSMMAETLNSLQIQLDWATTKDPLTRIRQNKKRGTVVGFISSVGSEGKTTAATNFATMLALQSSRVVLLDLDLGRSDLSRRLGPIIPQQNTLGNLILERDASILRPSMEFEGLTIVSSDGGESLNLPNSDDAEELSEVLNHLRDHFDFIIIDAPPLQGLVDSTVVSWLCDKLVFVVQWGATKPGEVQLALQRLRDLGDRLVGVVYSLADLERFLKYNKNATKGVYY